VKGASQRFGKRRSLGGQPLGNPVGLSDRDDGVLGQAPFRVMPRASESSQRWGRELWQ
jgi:hypothetical protein